MFNKFSIYDTKDSIRFNDIYIVQYFVSLSAQLSKFVLLILV